MSRFQKQILPKVELLANTLDRPMVLCETGTIRQTAENYHEGDGWSTLYLARFVKRAKHANVFYSVDLTTSTARQFLTEKGLIQYVTLVEQSSLDFLKAFNGQFDFVYLDSANDADLTLAEFKLAVSKLHPKGFIAIDDVDLTSPELMKGKKVIPYAKKEGYSVNLLTRQAIIRCS